MNPTTRRFPIHTHPAALALAVLGLAVSALPATAGEPQRFPPPMDLAPGTSCLQAPVKVTGKIQLQGEERLTDAVVTLEDSSGAAQSTVTDAAGHFGFERVCPGRARLKADVRFFSPHLAALAVDCVIPRSGIDLEPIELPTGDVDDDRRVDEKDLELIKLYWHMKCPFPNPPFPDLNGDCIVDILDATLAGINYGTREPVRWTCKPASDGPGS